MNKTLKRILIILGSFVSFIIVAILITVVITAITLHNAEFSYGVSSKLAAEIPPEEIIKNPKAYDGKFIRVKGTFNYYLEDVSITPEFDEKLSPEDNEFLSSCFWLDDSWMKSSLGANLEDLYIYRGKTIVIEGNVNPYKNGHFGCYPCTIENISYISIEKGRKIYPFETSGFISLFTYWLEYHFPSPYALWKLMV